MASIYNFCAGPAMLPVEVMQQAQQEFLNWQGCGSSVMEISRRSKPFVALAQQAEQDLRDLLGVPDDYHVLFMHGGGRGQFAAVPLNLAAPGEPADYLTTGSWSSAAIAEANKYVNASEVAKAERHDGLWRVPDASEWHLNPRARYFHYCPNETVDGIEMPSIPEVSVPVVADMSSCILSKPIDVARFGLIYAGAQKNIGPSGLSVVIVKRDLLNGAQGVTPAIFDYAQQAAEGSMYNTPPTYAWYLAGLVFKWLKAQGGLEAMHAHNQAKAELLYHTIDHNDFYQNQVACGYRSRMNVPFQLARPELDGEFLRQAEQHGLMALQGHRSVGGMRASIYNAMPISGVKALTDFMQEFARTMG